MLVILLVRKLFLGINK